MRSPVMLVAALLALPLASCSAEPAAPAPAPETTSAAGPRIIREDHMPQYLDLLLNIYQSSPGTGYLCRNGWDESSQHNAELAGRQMCALIIAGIDPDDAYGAAYPAVKAAGNITAQDKQAGAIADQVLCPQS